MIVKKEKTNLAFLLVKAEVAGTDPVSFSLSVFSRSQTIAR